MDYSDIEVIWWTVDQIHTTQTRHPTLGTLLLIIKGNTNFTGQIRSTIQEPEEEKPQISPKNPGWFRHSTDCKSISCHTKAASYIGLLTNCDKLRKQTSPAKSGQFKRPRKKKPQNSQKACGDNFHIQVIWRIVNQFQTTPNRHPTLGSLLSIIQENINFTGQIRLKSHNLKVLWHVENVAEGFWWE